MNNFYRNASPAQRRRFLPAAITGEQIGGMCMTEPEAGTDVLGMRTTARRDGDHYVINGRKTFITNGAVDDQTLGDVFLVYARTGERSISTLVVEKGTPGFSLGQLLEGEARRARLDDRRAGLRQLPGARRPPARRRGREHAAHDAQPRARAPHAGRDVARHRPALPRR